MDTNQNSDASIFGVQENFELGTGDPRLLNAIFDEEIEEEIKDDQKKEPEQHSKKQPEKKETASKDKEEEEVVTTLSGEELINSLLDIDDEEEEEEEEPSSITKTKSPEKKEKQTDQEEEEEEEENESIFSTFSKDLFKIGAFTKDEEEEDVNISTPEQFLERLNLEKKKGAQEEIYNFLSAFGEDYRAAFEAIYVKGVDPKQYFSSYNEIVDYASLDMTDEENQVKVVRRMLSDQGFDPEDIESEVEKLKNYGDIETTSARYHKAIVKKDVQKLEQMTKQAEAQQAQKEQEKQQYILNVQNIIDEKAKTKEFDGIPLSGNMANELKQYMITPKYKTKEGKLLTDFDFALMQLEKPENHSLKIKVGLLLKTLEKDPTLSTIQKTGVTKKTDTLFSEVARMGKKNPTTVNKSTSKMQDLFKHL